MSIMCFLAIAIAYVMRVCLSVAITEMVKKVNQTETSHKGYSICVADPSTSGNSSSSVTNYPHKIILYRGQLSLFYKNLGFRVTPVNMSGHKINKDIFCLHSTSDMYLLMFLVVL